MKIRLIDDSLNPKILMRNTYFEEVNDDRYVGYIGVTDIIYTSEEVYVPREGRKPECILASGMKRLRVFPTNTHYTINAVYDSNFNFIEFYIDIVNKVGLNKENVPYMEDLFLDIVFTHKDEILILDEDELDEALDNNEISKEQYDMCLKQKDELVNILSNKQESEALKKYCHNELLRLYSKLK